MANGGIIGPVNNPTSTTATGVWQQEEQYEAVRDGTWPERALFTTKSARFNSGSSDYLSKTFSSAGNRKTWTWSGWVKRSVLGTYQIPFIAKSGSAYSAISFVDDQLRFFDYDGAFDSQVRTNRVFRDSSAWYHIVVAYDTAQSTASNRVKIYVNGVQETSFTTANYPSLNFDGYINAAYTHYIGTEAAAGSYFDGYMSEVIFIDGQALTPTSFGVTNSDGVWTPIIYSGTYGTNGFNLQFEDAAALGTDSSPNGNTFTVNNLTSIDQSTDYPVVNYSTANPLDVMKQSGGIYQPTFSNGNLTISSSAANNYQTFGTLAVDTGKWYWETKATDKDGHRLGVFFGDNKVHGGTYYYGTNAFYIHQNGQIYYNGSSTTYMSSLADGDIVGVALDRTNGQIYLHKNGQYADGNGNNDETFANAVSISTKLGVTMPSDITYPFFDVYGTAIMDINFGSPAYAISSGNADGNGYGNFEYAVPSGYYALNTANLAEFG